MSYGIIILLSLSEIVMKVKKNKYIKNLDIIKSTNSEISQYWALEKMSSVEMAYDRGENVKPPIYELTGKEIVINGKVYRALKIWTRTHTEGGVWWVQIA